MNGAADIYAYLAAFSFRNHLGSWRYTVSRLASFIFFTLIISEFWRAIIAQGTRQFPFDSDDIVWYCGVAQLIVFASTRIFVRIEDDVLSGNIAYSLLRPINYVEMRLAEGVGGLIANLILFLPVGFVVCFSMTGHLPRGSIIGTCVLIVLASLLHMLFQILAGFSGVWLGEVQLPYRIYQKFMILMGGLEVPISLYPIWAQLISWATPLGLLLSRPCTAIYNPDLHEMLLATFFMASWVVFLFAITLRGYEFVHRRITVQGG